MKTTRKYLALLLAVVLILVVSGCGESKAVENAATAALSAETRDATPVMLAAAAPAEYTDVSTDAWYAAAVRYVSGRGLMIGTSDDEFSPDGTFTRAQLATVLYRLAGEPTVTGEDSFTDTTPGAWYTEAVLWASRQGIVEGYGGGMFGPNDPVTQEHMVTMLWRNDGEPAPNGAATDDDVTKAVAWANETGVTGGTLGYSFAAKENASRAQVAALLQSYLTKDGGGQAVTGGTIQTAGAAVEAAALEHLTDSDTAPVVYFTSDISADGLVAVYEALGWNPAGKVAVKLSTGEPPASNYLRTDLIADLVHEVDGTIVEAMTAYGGQRGTVAMAKQVAADHGFTSIASFDLLDEDGEMDIPITGGTRIEKDIVGTHIDNYDSWLILSHFKGHSMAGLGGAIKNVSIGMASKHGKVYLHTAGERTEGMIMHNDQNAWLEALPEAVKGVRDYVGAENIVYVSVMNRLSVDCDCDGHAAEPDMHDVGVLASTDPVALDQACVDFVYAVPDGEKLIERMETRNGIRAIEHGEEIGLGSRAYRLVNIDNAADTPSPAAQTAALKSVNVSFDFQRSGTHASHQVAVWVENASGEIVKTLYVTDFTAARRGYTTRPESLSAWVTAADPAAMSDTELDAISSATPGTGTQTFTWDLTDSDGNRVPDGVYAVKVEGTMYWNSNVLYTAEIDTAKTAGGALTVREVRSEPDNTENAAMLSNVRVTAITE